MHKWTLFVACALLMYCSTTCATSGFGEAWPEGDWQQDVAAAESAMLSRNRARAESGIQWLDNVTGIALRLPTSQGTIAARLWLSARCLLKHDRRLVVLIPGTLANGAGYYEMDVAGFEGFDAAGVLARAGYCAMSIDLPGTGESFRPDNAMNLRAADNAAAVAEVARPVSLLLGIRHWDVYAETATATPPALLLARRHDVRSLIISSPFYLRFGPASAQAFDPGVRAVAAVTPYFPMDPALISLFVGAAPAQVQAAAIPAILGPVPHAIPTGAAFNEIAEVPFSVDSVTNEFVLAFPIVDAGQARIDALILQGSPDVIGSEAGTDAFVAAYGVAGGGAADLVVIPGASHLMRLDAAFGDGPGSAVWSPILAFLASH